MSRLYDALKGARNLPRSDRDAATEGVLEALAIQEMDGPQADYADASTSQAPEAAVAQVVEAVVEETPADGDVQSGEISLGIPVNATVNQKTRVIPNAIDPAVAEHYRRLRTKIMQRREQSGFRSLLVTSAAPQEGKTLTVLNLGLSFAMLPSFRVLLVDGDVRRATLGKWLGMEEERPGLSNLIDGSAQLEDVVCKSADIAVHFVTRGNSRVTDLHSSQLRDHFQRMSAEYDLVLVDSPPVNLVADTQLLAANCDAVLLVARAYVTTRKAYEKAVQDLRPFQLIGTVLNAGAGASDYHGYY